MNQFKYYLIILLLATVCEGLFSMERIINVTDILVEFDNKMGDAFSEEYDSNNDGSIDYLLRTDFNGDKILELLDYNHDGEMDDIYFYSDGIIVRREIDSNFDMNIDIWVYIKDGTIIEKYEQDVDYNGDIDDVKIFDMEG